MARECKQFTANKTPRVLPWMVGGLLEKEGENPRGAARSKQEKKENQRRRGYS